MFLLDSWGLGKKAPCLGVSLAVLLPLPSQGCDGMGFGQPRILRTKNSAWPLWVCSRPLLSTTRFTGPTGKVPLPGPGRLLSYREEAQSGGHPPGWGCSSPRRGVLASLQQGPCPQGPGHGTSSSTVDSEEV